MHELQMVPPGESNELPHTGATLMPLFEREALVAELLADELVDDEALIEVEDDDVQQAARQPHEDDVEDDTDRTADLSALSPVTGVCALPATRHAGTPAAELADTWLTAAEAAEALDISVRHLRRLATAGKVERRRQDERTVYRIAPWLQELEQAERTATAATTTTPADETGASTRSPDTCRAADPAAAAAASDDSEAASAEATGVIERARVRPRGRSAETVVALDEVDVIVATDDSEKVVAQELVATNRELMRLVEGMLGRWSEVNAEQTRAQDEIKTAMRGTLEVQQCLQHWQHHAATLERQLLETLHLATRALDVADEALASRWTSGKRQRTLRERLEQLRGQIEPGTR